MKLLVVSHSCASAANQRLYSELRKLTGWDITLTIPALWKDEFGNQLDDAPTFDGRVEKVPVFANGNIIFHVYRRWWKAFLDREKFDAIYVNHEPYALATAHICLANLRRAKPAVFGFYSCQNIRKDYPFPFSALERTVYSRSKFAFPITDAVENVLREKGYVGASTVCALPLDPAIYRPRGADEDQKLIPREPGEFVIGYVGRLVEPKGLRTLAAALKELRGQSWKLVLIGAGDFDAEFRKLLDEGGVLDRATFLGFIPHDETPRYLSAFDALVLPSETQANWKEQFGRVITESLACGTAVIGSDSGEIPNLIRASEGGLVFPERNAQEFAKALQTLIASPSLAQDFAARGMAWTIKNMTLTAIAAKMASTIEGAMYNAA